MTSLMVGIVILIFILIALATSLLSTRKNNDAHEDGDYPQDPEELLLPQHQETKIEPPEKVGAADADDNPVH